MRKHKPIYAQVIGVLSCEMILEKSQINNPEIIKDEIIKIAGDITVDTTLSEINSSNTNEVIASFITNDDNEYKSPKYLPINSVSYLLMLEGESTLRLGGWKQRQDPVDTFAGDIIGIYGEGKIAIDDVSGVAFNALVVTVKNSSWNKSSAQ